MASRVRRLPQLLRIAATLVAAAGAKHLLGTRRAARLLDRVARARPGPPLSPVRHVAAAHALAHDIDVVAARLPLRPRCLTRSLVLAAALRRVGVPVALRVGVSRVDGFAAHSWVEVGGVPIGSDGATGNRYAPLWTSE